jgi:hypothetical protein
MKTKLMYMMCGLAAVFFLYELLIIIHLWTPVGYVDTWPLYHRFEKLASGEIGLIRLLLEPHVHPHAIVFLIYLFDYWIFGLRQILPTIISIGSIIGTAILLIYILFNKLKTEKLDKILILSFLCTAPLLLGLPTGESIIPFQTVVVTSRFLYMAILLYVIQMAYMGDNKEWYKAIFLVSVSMTFYASAGVIAFLVIIVSFLSNRGWKRISLSIVPLALYLLLIKYFYTASVEGPIVADLIRNIDFELIKNLILGACAYIATPLNAAFRGLNINFYITFGGIILFLALISSAAILIEIFLNRTGNSGKTVVLTFMLCINAWVIFSAFSTSLLWLARIKIPGFEGFNFLLTITTSMRYATFATLLIIILILTPCVISLPKYIARFTSITLASVSFAIVWGALTPQRISEERAHINEINLSATAVLMNVNFSNKIASEVWPGTAAGSYWSEVFGKINKYMLNFQLGYASNTYKLNHGINSKATITPLVNVTINEISGLQVCSLEANATQLPDDFFFPNVIKMVADENNIVVGYGIQKNNKVLGYILCDNSTNTLKLVEHAR